MYTHSNVSGSNGDALGKYTSSSDSLLDQNHQQLSFGNFPLENHESCDGQQNSSHEESVDSPVQQRDKTFVKLARRRASRGKASTRRPIKFTKPQGRPLSKETTVRLALVPTLGILYSILVSDNSRRQLTVLKYSDGKDALVRTDEELSTRKVLSGFSSMLNVQAVKLIDDPSVQTQDHSKIPEFHSIDEAVYALFGLNEYSLIRVTRAAATEVGGSVLLKIETAMPGLLYLNDDEDMDFSTLERNSEMYHSSLGDIGDRPTSSFLKKRVARPRYKADMRIYLIPKAITCAIYCEERIFNRDLKRGFLDFTKSDRSIISAFSYEEFMKDLIAEGDADLIAKYALPDAEQVEAMAKSTEKRNQALQHSTHVSRSPQPSYENSGYPVVDTKHMSRSQNLYSAPTPSTSSSTHQGFSDLPPQHIPQHVSQSMVGHHNSYGYNNPFGAPQTNASGSPVSAPYSGTTTTLHQPQEQHEHQHISAYSPVSHMVQPMMDRQPSPSSQILQSHPHGYQMFNLHQAMDYNPVGQPQHIDIMQSAAAAAYWTGGPTFAPPQYESRTMPLGGPVLPGEPMHPSAPAPIAAPAAEGNLHQRTFPTSFPAPGHENHYEMMGPPA